jgi:two-component system, NtrC family, response regulator AlgB
MTRVQERARGEPRAEAKTAARVLIIDDERNIRKTLSVCLEGLGCQVTESSSSSSALEALARSPYDVAFVDLRLGREDGLELLPRLLAERPGLDVVMITAYATFDTAVEAIKRGAKDYLPKPFTPAQIQRVIEASGERRALEHRVIDLEARLADAAPEATLEGSSAPMRTVLEMLSRTAAHDVPVLLRGESGTGKSVLARALHQMSPRRDRVFGVVNCPALSEELLASELFGHTKGAFTGAVRDRVGHIEAAEGGTLFLDEVGEIPPPMQAKLLRFLQDKQFERVGETRTRRADVRIVAATNKDLEAAVKSGQFREDLHFRLNVVEVTVPSLRDRREEILPLARRFIEFFVRRSHRDAPRLTPEAEAALVAYPWPGNVRELRNAIERAVILTPGQRLGPEAFPGRIADQGSPTPSVGGDFTVEALEREHILRVLGRTRTQEEASRILGVDASTLWRKRRKYEGG